jgi:SNF2 family DNA or RNA helicase
MRYEPHPYQTTCEGAIVERPAVALWLEMGLGKTAITLTAIERLEYDACEVQRVLIVAPHKVAEATWQDEAAKWDHLQGLTFSTILGTAKQRTEALHAQADIYVTGRDNLVWLTEQCGRHWPFDMVVLDEASSFKHANTQRFKALRRVRPQIKRIVELTGTPAPKDLIDLWAQVFLLDQGERLGKRLTGYREHWFEPDKRNATTIFSWRPRVGAEDEIRAGIADLCISLQAADYLAMPERVEDDIPVCLSPAAAKRYKQLERDALLEVDGETITAQQAATLTGKLLQLCNGSLYDEAHYAHELHTDKLDALCELVEGLQGEPALVFYQFAFDLPAITAALQRAQPGIHIEVLRGAEQAQRWNRGEYDVLLAQPASCAYGLNLQAGGRHVIWYSLPWALELYQQGNARVYRQGQDKPVFIHRLLVKGGADELVASALARKDGCQAALMQGLKAKIATAHTEMGRK